MRQTKPLHSWHEWFGKSDADLPRGARAACRNWSDKNDDPVVGNKASFNSALQQFRCNHEDTKKLPS